MDKPGDKTDEEEVVDLGPLSLGGPAVEEGPAIRVEQTRATLAFCLLGLLSAVLGTTLGLLAAGTITPAGFDNVTGVVVAPVVGLLGAATGYYYGRGER